jgi:hypothetical protein
MDGEMELDPLIGRTGDEEVDDPKWALTVMGGYQGQTVASRQQRTSTVDELIRCNLDNRSPRSLGDEVLDG